jgi:hypothetical protein
MIKYKITGFKYSHLPKAYKKLQCNNGGIGEGTWLANHRNKLFATKIRRQQRSETLPTYYVLMNHVQNPNSNNNQKNWQSRTSYSRAEMMSPWK